MADRDLRRVSAEVDWREVARLVLTSREMDRIEEQELAPAGKITYQFSSKGHELAQLLLGATLIGPHDAAGVYYRSRPFMLASGLTPAESFAADMALTGSPSEGRDVGVVYSMKSRGRATVLPSSGDVGAQYTPAAGWAQAIQYHVRVLKDESWNGAVAAVLAAGVNPLVRVVFGFDAETSSLITWTTRAYLLTLTGFSIQEVAARSFYARKEPMFPLYAVVLRLALFLLIGITGITLFPNIGAPLIAFAEIALLVESIVLFRWLSRRR